MKEIFYRSPNLAHRKNKTKVLEQKPKVKKVWKQKFGKQKPPRNGTLFCSVPVTACDLLFCKPGIQSI